MQGFHIFAGGTVAIVISSIFCALYHSPPFADSPIVSTVPQADYVWRVILMFGALPAALTYSWQMKMPETPRYTALVAKSAEKTDTDMLKVFQVDIRVEKQRPREPNLGQNSQFRALSERAPPWAWLALAGHNKHLFLA